MGEVVVFWFGDPPLNLGMGDVAELGVAPAGQDVRARSRRSAHASTV
ncbi:MAG: hypothetical protein KDB38_04380 [Nocardioidaceae bacterium]|nr:hypothetical protein [Nocardioidaceae bacterium]